MRMAQLRDGGEDLHMNPRRQPDTEDCPECGGIGWQMNRSEFFHCQECEITFEREGL